MIQQFESQFGDRENFPYPYCVYTSIQGTRMSSKKKAIATRKNSIMHGIDTSFKLKQIIPSTDAQKDVFDAWEEGYNLFMHGCPGTGKTFIALYLAFKKLLDTGGIPHKKIYIVRSCVQGRGMGFLPGKPNEKMMEFEGPYADITGELFGRGDAYSILKAKDSIEFISTSFLRGKTFRDCIIIVDEPQNMNWIECDTIITRVGPNCKIMFCGDYMQSDLIWKDEREGFREFIKIIDLMEEDFEFIEFEVGDIVRSEFVKNYITAKLKYEETLSTTK